MAASAGKDSTLVGLSLARQPAFSLRISASSVSRMLSPVTLPRGISSFSAARTALRIAAAGLSNAARQSAAATRMSMAIRLVARLGPGSSGMVENRPSAPRPAGGIGTAEAKLLLVLGIGAHDLGDQRVAHHIGLDEADERSEEHTSELQSLMRISYAA